MLLAAIASLALAGFAFARSRVPGGFYDRDVYGMTAVGHVRYAVAFAAFAAVLVLCRSARSDLSSIAFAGLGLVAVFYLTSFLRGFHEDDG